jgi:hypothetical protein
MTVKEIQASYYIGRKETGEDMSLAEWITQFNDVPNFSGVDIFVVQTGENLMEITALAANKNHDDFIDHRIWTDEFDSGWLDAFFGDSYDACTFQGNEAIHRFFPMV